MASDLQLSPPEGSLAPRLNWLRAGVLGANDGIVSTAGLLLGVAGATSNEHTIFVAGLAGVVAGALSMAMGEYVSVSTQKDSELALIAREREALEAHPEAEFEKLIGFYEEKGLSRDLAEEVARELTEQDAVKAHMEAELGLDPSEVTSPLHAAVASMGAFVVGALFPLALMLCVAPGARVLTTVLAAALALVLTGWVSATLGFSSRKRAMVRSGVGGLLAMAVTYGVGALIGGVAAFPG